MESNKNNDDNPEKRLQWLREEEKVIVSALKQIKLKFIELECEHKELKSAYYALQNKQKERKNNQEKPEHIEITETVSSKFKNNNTNNEELAQSSTSYDRENVCVDFDEIVTSNINSEYITEDNLDELIFENDLPNTLLQNKDSCNTDHNTTL